MDIELLHVVIFPIVVFKKSVVEVPMESCVMLVVVALHMAVMVADVTLVEELLVLAVLGVEFPMTLAVGESIMVVG